MTIRNMNYEYHSYLRNILADDYSVFKSSRAGGNIATTGGMMRFNLAEGFPLINTKRLFYRGILHEVVWFLNGPEADGEMHIDYLIENKCNFWTGNLFDFYLKKQGKALEKYSSEWNDTYAAFEDNLKNSPEFRRRHGSLGRPYSAQWRDWRCSDRSSPGQSMDQMALAMDLVKGRSDSRRIVVMAWRPDEIGNMALPPCHMSMQFVVMNDRLDIQMLQRSCDSFLGVPFNIASYAAIGSFVAAYAGLKPGIFTHQLVDTHIYAGDPVQAEWYRSNFNLLRSRVKEAKVGSDYLEIKEWILRESPKGREEPDEGNLDHVTAVLEQLSRDIYRYPIANLEVKVDQKLTAKEALDKVSFEDFVVEGYKDNYFPEIRRRMPV